MELLDIGISISLKQKLRKMKTKKRKAKENLTLYFLVSFPVFFTSFSPSKV